jgi:hypothetical protein
MLEHTLRTRLRLLGYDSLCVNYTAPGGANCRSPNIGYFLNISLKTNDFSLKTPLIGRVEICLHAADGPRCNPLHANQVNVLMFSSTLRELPSGAGQTSQLPTNVDIKRDQPIVGILPEPLGSPAGLFRCRSVAL